MLGHASTGWLSYVMLKCGVRQISRALLRTQQSRARCVKPGHALYCRYIFSQLALKVLESTHNSSTNKYGYELGGFSFMVTNMVLPCCVGEFVVSLSGGNSTEDRKKSSSGIREMDASL